MCGCVDVYMCGCVDVWMRGCVDAWMRECVEAWMCGYVDMRMSGGDYHVNECGICVLPWVYNSLWFCAFRVWHRFAQAGLGLRRLDLRRLRLHRDDA